MSFSPRISIIIPVYNAEQYLDACITSIVNQPYRDFEVIFVDDHSTDNSTSLIEQKADSDARIRLFRQSQNQGAPAARNIGIQQAKGAYLMFVDADDMLAKNALKALVGIADQYGSDAVKGIMFVKTEDSQRLKPHRLNQKLSHIDTQLSNCPEIQHLYQYQSYLLRSEMLKTNRLAFDLDLRNFQDPVFLAKLLPKCSRIDVCLSPAYIRRIRPGSIITSTWGIDNYLSLVTGVMRAYEDLLEAHQIGAAELMSTSFSRWWGRLEDMPVHISKSECLQVLHGIANFSQQSMYEINNFNWLKIGKYHSLRMISERKFEDAYQQMELRARMKTRLGQPLLSLYDIAKYCQARMYKRT